jgi:hypothetical protein
MGKTNPDFWTVLLPVIVGGALALLGSIAGPMAMQMISTRYEERKLRRERFEEMIGTVYSHDHWIEKVREKRLFHDDDEETVTPLNRAIAISALYFPNLLDELKTLELSTAEYEVWMYAAREAKLSGGPPVTGDDFRPIYERYRAAFLAFHNKATEYAKRRLGKV